MKNLWKNVFRYGARFQFDDGREVTLHKRDWILLKMRDAAPGQIQRLHKIKRSV